MLKTIGNNCREWRLKKGYLQADVARDTKYSIENVSAFENGRNDNYRIFVWYLLKGIPLKKLFEGVEDVKDL